MGSRQMLKIDYLKLKIGSKVLNHVVSVSNSQLYFKQVLNSGNRRSCHYSQVRRGLRRVAGNTY